MLFHFNHKPEKLLKCLLLFMISLCVRFLNEQILLLMQDRIAALKVAQMEREEMAELIELNSDLVDKALLVIRSAIANQVILS